MSETLIITDDTGTGPRVVEVKEHAERKNEMTRRQMRKLKSKQKRETTEVMKNEERENLTPADIEFLDKCAMKIMRAYYTQNEWEPPKEMGIAPYCYERAEEMLEERKRRYSKTNGE